MLWRIVGIVIAVASLAVAASDGDDKAKKSANVDAVMGSIDIIASTWAWDGFKDGYALGFQRGLERKAI